MWKGAGSQEPGTAAVERKVALDELGRFAAGYRQLALGVSSSAAPLQWWLAPQEGSHRGFDLSQGEPAALGRCPGLGSGEVSGGGWTLGEGRGGGEAAFFPHCPSFLQPLGLGRMLPGWGWGSGCPYIPGNIIPT